MNYTTYLDIFNSKNIIFNVLFWSYINLYVNYINQTTEGWYYE